MKTSEVARLTGANHGSLLNLANGHREKLYGVYRKDLFDETKPEKERLRKNVVGQWNWPEWVVDRIKEGREDV